MQNETQFQSDVVRKFSELHTDKRGQLIHVANERTGGKMQAMRARAVGIVPGTADLLFFSFEYNVATELKVPGRRHDVERVEVQVWWGKLWEEMGNHWRLCRTVKEAINCYEGNLQGLTLKEVEKMLSETKTKTIKF
jgi:hypothetical protein